MNYTDRESGTAPADELLADMPLPADPKTIFLGGLFALALLATAWARQFRDPLAAGRPNFRKASLGSRSA